MPQTQPASSNDSMKHLLKQFGSKEALKKEARYVLKQKHVRQTILNYLSHFLSIFLSIATITLVVNALGAEQYGKIGLITTIISTIAIFVGFGYYQGYGRLLLTIKDTTEQREFVATGFLFYLSQVLFLLLLTQATLPLITQVYNDPALTNAIFLISGFSSWTVMSHFFINTARSLNHMRWMAAQKLIQPAIYLVFILALIWSDQVGFVKVLAASYSSLILMTGIYLLHVKPRFQNLKQHWERIREEKKAFGVHIYISRAVEQVTYNLDNMMLGMYMYDFVAFYNLGMKLVSPILNFTNFFTQATLRKMHDTIKIPARVFLYNILWWAVTSAGLLILSEYVILLLWGPEYLIIKQFLWLLCVYVLCSALYYIIYMFLYTKGYGKQQKKHFYLRAAMNLGGNIILIPLYGIMGAVIATVLSSITFLFGMMYEYHRYCKQLAYE